jgi:hypothetical protein
MQASIDEDMASLIGELWKAGIVTVTSCEENRPGIAWIQFATAEDAACFLDIVVRYEEGDDTLYNWVTGRWAREHPPAASRWGYALLPEDLALHAEVDEDDSVDEWHDGVPEFVFSVSVRFPRTDLGIVLERMMQHNARA